jgi:hypothetical protein
MIFRIFTGDVVEGAVWLVTGRFFPICTQGFPDKFHQITK